VVGTERPAVTAGELLEEWLDAGTIEGETLVGLRPARPGAGETGDAGSSGAAGGAEWTVLIGTLDQHEVADAVESAGLPTDVEHDGYAFGWSNGSLVVYANLARGLVYAVAWELPRRATLAPHEVLLPRETVVTSPTDRIRAFRYWTTGGEDFVPHAALRFRLNRIWIASHPLLESSYEHAPALAGFAERHAAEREELRRDTERAIDLAHRYGLEIYVGGSYQLWHLPDDLYADLVAAHPDLLEGLHYEPSSPWPPAPWMDRPTLCICNPLVRKLYAGVVDEFLSIHPDADGYGSGFGYDGYPFAASCPKCREWSYHDRMRSQADLLYDVAVARHGRKLAFWTWAGGPLLAIPGYDYYYGWLADYVQRDPDNIMPAIFAVNGDFNPVYPLNPHVGSRGPNDCALLLTWHDYRGDSVVPAWLATWMADSLPRLREQGAAGFFAMEAWPDRRITDPVHRAELAFFGMLTWDGSRTAQDVARQYCAELLAGAPENASRRLADALVQSGDIVDRALFDPDGIRLARHCEIDEDMRMLWDVSVLMDSGPFFLDEEAKARVAAHPDGIMTGMEEELAHLTSPESIRATLALRDRAVAEAEGVLATVRALVDEAHEQRPGDEGIPPSWVATLARIEERCRWLVDYTALLRGYTRALLTLKRLRAGAHHDTGGTLAAPNRDASDVLADEIVDPAGTLRAAAEEMAAAFARLPDAATIADRGVFPYWSSNGPWHLPQADELFSSVRTVADIVERLGRGASNTSSSGPPSPGAAVARSIAVLGDPWAADYLESLFVPFTRVVDVAGLVADRSDAGAGGARDVMILGSDGVRVAARDPEPILQRVRDGALLLVHLATPDAPLTLDWLPGGLGLYLFSADSVVVADPLHPITAGLREVRSKPVPIRGKERPPQAIRAYAGAAAPWHPLTYPAVLLECELGKGRIIANLVPENRGLFLRCVAAGLREGEESNG